MYEYKNRCIFTYVHAPAPPPYRILPLNNVYIYIYIFASHQNFNICLFKILQQGDTVNVPEISARQDTSVLNHRRFCNWTDRSPEELSQELVRDVYRACVAVEKLGH